MIRAFIALPLPEAIRNQLAVTQFLLPLPRPVPPANMHLTLAFLGTLAEPVLEESRRALSNLRAAPLTLSVAGLGVFGGDKPRNVHARLAPAPALDHLQARIAQAVRAAGVPLEGKRFVPHVTLGRLRARPGQRAGTGQGDGRDRRGHLAALHGRQVRPLPLDPARRRAGL
jgi:RNA 2',3'-cyclic 3'-phosphodiesterase